MARKTFGRDGQPILIDGDEVRRIVVEDGDESKPIIFDPVAGDDSSPVIEDGSDAGNDSGVEDKAAGTAFVDPATAAGSAPKKRRGRQPGTKNKPKDSSASAQIITANLEKVLINLHVMAAGLLAEPTFVIDEDEAKLLADAVTEVAKAYDFSAILSPKTQAGIDLTIALVTVYGGRVMKIMQQQKRQTRNVTPINNGAAAR